MNQTAILLGFLSAASGLILTLHGNRSVQSFPELPETQDSIRYDIELGKRLFYDPVLSRDSTISCATCHVQSLAFTDGRPTSVGLRGRIGKRNAPTLTNVGNRPYLLLDGVNPSLEKQIMAPIQEHTEFDFHIALIVERLKRNPDYVQLAKKAYGEEIDHRTVFNSIASFERTLVSNQSPYDRYRRGDEKALSRSQKRGMNLFFNKLYCAECHSGTDFTNDSLTNNGLYVAYADSGRMRLSELEKDRAIFKTPTLRNIELTAPYMHNGSFSSLEAVIDHYSSGGKNHPKKAQIIQPFKLSKREKQDLIQFLYSLTDNEFISNPDYANPFQNN